MIKPSEERIAKGLWWDRNWPVLEGCSHVSPACDNCFAAEYAHRFESSLPYLHGLTTPAGKWTGNVTMRADQLDLPLRIKKPTVWFVAERSDLFHPSVPDEYLDRIFAAMALCPQHTFMVLTKRPERMLGYLLGPRGKAPSWPLPNVWLGVTAENQEQADKRVPVLLQTPAAHRFVSVEPMLGPIDLTNLPVNKHERWNAFAYPVPNYPRVDWVICGLESGHNARPGHPIWVRALRDQCAAAGVPFFFKQWGEWIHELQADFSSSPFSALASRNAMYHVWEGGARSYRVGKKDAGRLLDGKEHLVFP
jgi:protein gp37